MVNRSIESNCLLQSSVPNFYSFAHLNHCINSLFPSLFISGRPLYELEQEAILEGHLATEATLIVVDALELLVSVSII